MCRYLSAIGRENGDVFYSAATDSHEYLIAAGGFREPSPGREAGWCRVEFAPVDAADLVDIKKYELNIDQEEPRWLTDATKEKWETKLREIAKDNIITSGERALLLGGSWVLGGDVKVQRAVNARIVVMLGNSSVAEMFDGSSVGAMLGNSSVAEMFDGSSVGAMLGNSSVTQMFDSSSVGAMRGNSSVTQMLGNSSVGEMFDGSSVGAMLGNSSVTQMFDGSSVTQMLGNSSVTQMFDGSSVAEMFGSSSVGAMLGDSSVKKDNRLKANHHQSRT